MPRPVIIPTIDQKGSRLDFDIRQGSTLGPLRVTLRNPSVDPDVPGTPLNLTGCTVLGQVRKSPTAYGPPEADFVVAMASDLTQGYFDLTIPDEITATLPMIVDATMTRFYYDIELIDALGRVIPLHYGELRVVPEVTREDTTEPETSEGCC